jgi:hypothetical protein
LDSSSKDVIVVDVALLAPPLLCHTWSFFVLFAFTFVLSRILSYVWLFKVTKIYNNLEELSKNLGCAFVVFLLLSSAWTKATTLAWKLRFVCCLLN